MSIEKEIAFQPRASLRRTLRYQPFAKYPYYGTLALQVAFAVYLIIDLFSEFEFPTVSALSLWLPWCTLAIWILLNHLFLKPFLTTKIHLHATGMTIESAKKSIEIPLLDIKRLNLPNSFIAKNLIPAFFSVEMTSGEKYFFSVALERCEYLLETIASRRPDLIDLKKLAIFRVQVLLMDHGWTRQKDLLKKSSHILALKYLIWPLLQALVSIYYQTESLQSPLQILPEWFDFILVTLAIGLPIYLVNSLLITGIEKRTLRKNPGSVIRNMGIEKWLNRISNIAFWSLTILNFVIWLALVN